MWADCVFQDWEDCVWQDTTDNESDKFEMQDRTGGTRTVRLLPSEFPGNFRRPYLEGNPSYVEDTQRYSDVAIATALYKATGEIRSDMIFKQPYRYNEFLKMKYRNEPAFPHEETRIPETPMDIEAAIPEPEYEWRWVRYFDNSRWSPFTTPFNSTPIWFDDRWLPGEDDDGDYYVVLEVKGSWFRNFRPKKYRAACDGTAGLDVDLYDNMTTYNTIATPIEDIYSEERTIDWEGNNIAGIAFTWSAGDLPIPPHPSAVTNIEFYQQVEKGTYLASDQRTPRKQIGLKSTRASFPHPNPVRDSGRLPRRTSLRITR